MKKKISIVVILIGAALLIVGLALQLPGTLLSTSSWRSSDSQYSVIEEYVGGDAYNFIIGASIVAGERAGLYTMKAVFISVGLLIMVIGTLSLVYSQKAAPASDQQSAASDPSFCEAEVVPESDVSNALSESETPDEGNASTLNAENPTDHPENNDYRL